MAKDAKQTRINGRMVKKKRPDAKSNAATNVRYLQHGAGSQLLKSPFDNRTAVGKRFNASIAALRDHLGNDLTLPEEAICDQAARLALLADIAWRYLIDNDLFMKDGQISPAFDAWLKATRDQRAVLQLLGLKRREKPVQDLSSYIAEQEEQSK